MKFARNKYPRSFIYLKLSDGIKFANSFIFLIVAFESYVKHEYGYIDHPFSPCGSAFLIHNSYCTLASFNVSRLMLFSHRNSLNFFVFRKYCIMPILSVNGITSYVFVDNCRYSQSVSFLNIPFITLNNCSTRWSCRRSSPYLIKKSYSLQSWLLIVILIGLHFEWNILT